MQMTDKELNACHILLAAAHCGAPLSEMQREMRRERIPECTWRGIWDALGLMVSVEDEGDGKEYRVTFTENVVALIPRTKRHHRSMVGGSAA